MAWWLHFGKPALSSSSPLGGHILDLCSVLCVMGNVLCVALLSDCVGNAFASFALFQRAFALSLAFTDFSSALAIS
jgi:hypothetical protein